MNGFIAILISASIFLTYTESRELFHNLSECEMRVQQFNNESGNHRGFCIFRGALSERDVEVYGGWRVYKP